MEAAADGGLESGGAAKGFTAKDGRQSGGDFVGTGRVRRFGPPGHEAVGADEDGSGSRDSVGGGKGSGWIDDFAGTNAMEIDRDSQFLRSNAGAVAPRFAFGTSYQREVASEQIERGD